MNKNKRSVIKFSIRRENSNTNHADEALLKTNTKLETGNASPHSPQCSNDSFICGHSTPILKNNYTNDNIDDSPELYYGVNPISMPLTQDTIEVDWDWQTPKPSNNVTPKRPKHLRKKRNSNSPLLQQPVNRKMKIEKMESIGKFAAELKALSEKFEHNKKQQNYDNHIVKANDTKYKLNKSIIEVDIDSSDDIMADIADDTGKLKIDSIAVNNNNKKDVNYGDLFDDSIDDSMARCSQEIEQELNLCEKLKADTVRLPVIDEKKESSSIFENKFCYSTSSDNSTEFSKSSSFSKMSFSGTSSHLRTHSYKSLQAHFVNNVSNSINNVSNREQALQSTQSLSDDFPDDSFDDCLATCVDDKLYENNVYVLTDTENTNSKNKPKNKSNNCTENSSILFPNRKFFKTRSLSDQCFNQGNTSTSTSKNQRTVKSSVSTTCPTASNQYAYKNSFPAINSAANTHTLNRLEEERSGGNCIVKYNSTGNLSSIKEAKESQRVLCTPEEIERKRLEAKMKLEAKRKLHQMKKAEVTTKTSVKR